MRLQLSILAVTVLFAGTLAAQYTPPTYTNTGTSGDYVTNITIGAWSQAVTEHPAPDYAYNTGVGPGSLEVTFPYTATIQNNPNWPQGVTLFIDLNGDQDFADAGEAVGSVFLSSGAAGSINFSIPATATLGATRMRLMCAYNTTALPLDPTGTYGFGNCDDYDLTIAPLTSNVAPSIAAARDSTTTPVTINNNDNIQVALNSTVASLDLQFDVTDLNAADSISLASTVTPSANISGFTQSQWDAGTAVSPISANPASGTFTTAGTITVVLDATDGTLTAQLTFTIEVLAPALALSPTGPGAFSVGAPATDRVVTSFDATANLVGNQTISDVVVTKSGTVADTDITEVKLWVDVNNNGTLETGTDTQLGTNQTFTAGVATFSGLSEVVNASTTTDFLVTFTLAGTASGTFGADVTSVTATPGSVTGAPVTGPVHGVLTYVSALPFLDDFEPATVILNRSTQINGSFPSGTTTPPGSATFGADAQVQVGITTGTTTPLGTQHAMIDFPNGDACGAIDYLFDLSAYSASTATLVLSFDYAENADEPDNEDGVFLSLDGGVTWALNLNVLANGSVTYTTRTVDVSAALIAASLNYTNNVVIRFQGQDNVANSGGDGHFFDNIQLFEANEMDVLRGTTGVAVSATDTVDIVSAGSNLTYTIENNGGSPLNLTGASPFVVVTGVTNINTVTVTGIPTTPIAAGGNTTFTINVVPNTASAGGDPYSFTVSIANDDLDENPYDFTVSGNAFTNVPPAVSVPGTGSNWVDAGGGLFTLTLAPGATIADALTVTDATNDPMTVTVTNPTTALTTLTAQPVTNATATAGPISLAWAGTADGSNAPGVNFDWSIDINDGVSSTVITARIIITDVAPTSTILNASGGDGSSGTPY
ncbi:MAG: hypothetical protein KDB68_12355, partial [Planctomycetes bacterium]|nr:hypothetical protein [Planctomycetota bacterium]